METKLVNHLRSLNSINIESSLLIFRNCFSFLSFSLVNLNVEEIDNWIRHLENQTINSLWIRQKEMKYPSFILYFAIWHFRNKTLQERAFSRDAFERQTANSTKHDSLNNITNEINRDLDQLSAFDSVVFLGELIGAWMLTCPKSIILDGVDKTRNWQPNQSWLKFVYPDTLGANVASGELKLLYILDYRLYYTFEDLEAHNTE